MPEVATESNEVAVGQGEIRPQRPKDRLEEALRDCEAAIRAGRADLRLRWERFFLLSRSELLTDAREAVLELMGEGPPSARWVNAVAVTEARLGNCGRAESLFSRLAGSLGGQPLRQARVWSNLAALFRGLGDDEVAGAYAERAVQSDPTLLTAQIVARLAWPDGPAVTLEKCSPVGRTLHLCPYWHTDLDAIITRIPVVIREVNSGSRQLSCSYSPLGRPGDPRLLIESAHVGGIAVDGAHYGASFRMISRGPESLDLALSGPSGKLEKISLFKHP